MAAKLRPQLTYANVVSSICLFVVLGGTAFAATTVITGKDVKNASLTGKDVKNASLTGTDVKNGSLTGTDVMDKSLSPADFSGSVQGPKGDKGNKGDPGEKGDPGDPGLAFGFASFGGGGSLGTQAVAVAGMDLAAGDYTLYGNAIFTSTGTDPGTVHCALGISGTDGNEGSENTVDAGATQLAAQNAIPHETTMSLAGVVELDGVISPTTTVTMECYPEGTGTFTVTYRDADIGAVELDSLTFP
jgi:uncharacterized protein YjbI with pentapeptide repeats